MVKVLVSGAGGQLGRLVVDQLLADGKVRVVAGSRDPSRLADLAARGAETRQVDFDDPASLDAAFAGVDRLFVISTDAIDPSGRRVAQHRAAVAAAARAGVKHLVYTSMPNPGPGNAVLFAPDHHATEEAVKASGVPFTILRVSWYQENLLGSLPGWLAGGRWVTSAGEGRISHVARGDVARTAAAVLAAGGPAGRTLDVTGPAAMTSAEIAALVAEVFGAPVEVVHVGDDDLAAGLASAGVPDAFVPLLVSFDRNTREGGMSAPSDTVERLTGTSPRPLRAFLEAEKAARAG